MSVHAHETLSEHTVPTFAAMTFHTTLDTDRPAMKATPVKQTPPKITPPRQTPVKPVRS
jgi:hypothetical protein